MRLNYITFFASVFVIECKSVPENGTAIITEYAKVAHWGSASSTSTTTEKAQSEGRSSNGQTLWTHRSDVKIVRGQNLKASRPSVVYHYPEPRKPTRKIGQDKTEHGPGVGEVQERFNPLPYFDYTHIPGKASETKNTESKPDPTVAAPTFDSFPVFNRPQESDKSPPVDAYTSSYSSYNPPDTNPIPSQDDSPSYPPNAPPPPDDHPSYPPSDPTPDSNHAQFAPPPEDADSHPGYSYDPPKPDASFSYNPPNTPADTPPHPPEGPPKPEYASLGPPLAPQDDHPPKDEQLYYPPSDHGHPEVILDHPPPGYEDQKAPPEMAPPAMPAPDMPQKGMNGHDMAEHDLSPPPSPDYQGRFPQYLYNDPAGHAPDFGAYDFDHHHVYKEITTTTTTEAPEDERVNKGHYSYYYLGRKLWYIPLYFSVYFIIYVTVLILKSIARHKIDFKHKFHFDREARQMNSEDNIDEIHENVSRAIDTSRKKFSYIAM